MFSALDTFVDTLLFTPKPPSYDTSFSHVHRRLVAIRGTMDSRGGTVVYVPCIVSPARAPTDVLVVHFHGTAGDIAKSGLWWGVQERVPVHVVAVEYPGYGVFPGFNASDGKPMPPSDKAVCDVARIVMRHVINQWHWPVSRIIVSGRSMGSGPAAVMASEFQPGAVMLLSGFASLRDVAARKLRAAWLARALVRERFGNEGCLRKVRGHVLIVHGRRDPLIPFSHGERLATAAQGAASVEFHEDPRGTHWDVDTDDVMCRFVTKFTSARAAASAGEAGPSTLPLGRFDVDGADSLMAAMPWLQAAAALHTKHTMARRRRRLLTTIAVIALVLLFVWRRFVSRA
jgi:pimeloyl-ACP methyl ester carboxylesterase